jgi:hypothetical protein
VRLNRATWNVIEKDVRNVDGVEYKGIALLAGGVPCPPFSIAGKQLGADDERDLFLKRSALSKRRKPRQSCSRTYVGWPVRASASIEAKCSSVSMTWAAKSSGWPGGSDRSRCLIVEYYGRGKSTRMTASGTEPRSDDGAGERKGGRGDDATARTAPGVGRRDCAVSSAC